VAGSRPAGLFRFTAIDLFARGGDLVGNDSALTSV
jgi:hypothetical protein